MKKGTYLELTIVLCVLAGSIFWPLVVNGYWLGIGVDAMMYIALATSWVLFSGPTHYISLASAAFFGVGGFAVGLGMSDYDMSFWSMLIISAVAGTLLAALVGVATLRLSGVYFVIFTLGLAEMIRNLVSWVQNNFLGSRGLYVLTDFNDHHLFWMLLLTTATIYITGWLISRSRLGFALRIIGGDETVAKHVGINTAFAKIILFTTTGFFGAIVGAIIAPRWSYIEPNQVFSPQLSFFVVIMALLGGYGRLWGPIVGVVPFLLIWNWVDANFPSQSILVLGLAFLLIVYFLPRGVLGRLEELYVKLKKRIT